MRETLIKELLRQHHAPKAAKDILIVAHNQHEILEDCLNSIRNYTTNYRLFIWDNHSIPPLQVPDAYVMARSTSNWGFIEPNNFLITLATSPYIILLNSDVIVNDGWSEALLGYLEDADIIGYQGCLLNEGGYGVEPAWGDQIDYVAGWCMAFRRELYEEIGLFDPNLSFAYGEDSDFCLRAKEQGYKVYALHLHYTKHLGGMTIKNLKKDTNKTFQSNHEYLRSRWKDYLLNQRILAKKD